MGEFNKDQGQTDQAGKQTDKPAFGQFDKEQSEQQGDNQETNEKVQGDNQKG